MTTEEIQQYIDTAIQAHFDQYDSESGEIMARAGEDGRFDGKVIATRYLGIPVKKDLFLAIGQTDQQVQIVKLGKSECVKPDQADLDMLLLKELEIENKESENQESM